jgi:hypothetical protein
MPQPIPNINVPKTNFLSTGAYLGTEKISLYSGLDFLKIRLNVMKFTPRAPPITKASEGSQGLPIVRKF